MCFTLALTRFLQIRWGLAQLFKALADLPIDEIAKRLPKRVTHDLFRRFLGAKTPGESERLIEDRYIAQLRELYSPTCIHKISGKHVVEFLSGSTDCAASDTVRAQLAHECFKIAEQSWSKPEPPTPHNLLKELVSDKRWRMLAEEFALVKLIFATKRIAPIMRNLLLYLMLGPLLVLMAATFYPFQPQRFMAGLLWGMVFVGVVVAGWTYVQIDRDSFVSRVSGTTPNRLSLDQEFVGNLVGLALPIIGLVVTAFPQLLFWFRTVIEPLGRSLK